MLLDSPATLQISTRVLTGRVVGQSSKSDMDIGSNTTARCYVMKNIGPYFTGAVIILAKGSINEAGRCFSPDAT